MLEALCGRHSGGAGCERSSLVEEEATDDLRMSDAGMRCARRQALPRKPAAAKGSAQHWRVLQRACAHNHVHRVPGTRKAKDRPKMRASVYYVPAPPQLKMFLSPRGCNQPHHDLGPLRDWAYALNKCMYP